MQNQKSSSLFLWISFVIIAAIIIGGAGLYYYFLGQADSLNKSGKDYTVTNNSQTSSNGTADWETYSNEKYGFEFKYPKKTDTEGFMIDFYKDDDSKTTFCYTRSLVGHDTNYGDEETIIFDLVDNANNFTAKEFALDDLNSMIEDSKLNQYTIETLLEKNYSLDNRQGYYTKTKGNLFDNSNSIRIFITLDQKVLQIINNGSDKYFDKILSTFKFTSSNTDETADWETYNNSDLGLSFQYPGDWQDMTVEKNFGDEGYQYSITSTDDNEKIIFSADLQSKDYQNPSPLGDYDGETIFIEDITNGTMSAKYWNVECSPNLDIVFGVPLSSDNYKRFRVYFSYDFYNDDQSIFEDSDPCSYKEPYTDIANEIKVNKYDKGSFKEKLEIFKKIVETIEFSK